MITQCLTFIDIKQKDNGHFVYAAEAKNVKGSERPKAPTLYSDPKTILASGNRIAPAIADNIILGDQGNVKYSYAGQTAKTADHNMLTKKRFLERTGESLKTVLLPMPQKAFFYSISKTPITSSYCSSPPNRSLRPSKGR